MDGTNDSDNSMTWEDFFGSTTDLTPTLIGIYDSLLEPAKSIRPEVKGFVTAKDARNDPPVLEDNPATMTAHSNNDGEVRTTTKDPTKIPGGVKLPVGSINKSSLYSSMRTKSVNGVSEKKSDLTTSDSVLIKEGKVKTIKDVKQSEASFDNLSPNVKRMISSATETTTLKFQKKTGNVVRSSGRYRTNIPLVGATSKISQSGVEILPSVEIYDQPSSIKNGIKSKLGVDIVINKTGSDKSDIAEVQMTYDVPTNNRPAIYDVPNNKTAFESLSLPYIDQSIELSISANDREFDTKLSSKDNSPQKPIVSPKSSPKISTVDVGTNNLHRKEFMPKSDSPVKKLAKTQPYPEAIGSTGNLKSVIPEKDVPRLNPPTVEVSRPLSMSSIASSSSTSSSGVQNKGGVNSAYLASIESLDDHSDADLTSANGSNNFVNSQDKNMDNLPREQMEELSGLTQLERVLAEIVQTEKVYVEDLRQVVEGYLHVWRNEATFSSEELSELFNNIEDIYAFNRCLCSELATCSLDAACIARVFVANSDGFSVYTSYCTGYPRTMERLAELASKVQSAREFRDRQVALGHPLPVASYLLKPVQRILKYHLLLQNVVKHSGSEEAQCALHQMTGVAHHIDNMKRKHEHAVRVQEIQSLLYGWNGPDLTTYGELCAEGTFRVWGAKALRHVFLFDRLLLVTKTRGDAVLAYKSHIMCSNMMLVESIVGAALSFHVLPWDAPRRQLTLTARSPAHKREWTLLLKRVILENYNAVIPSHARQLVMELGQNKTDDDMLAEKSHNLISQASMRKQLSAPEYLEKRKLERERRKAFEIGLRGRMKKINRKHTVPNSRSERDCDCSQVSSEKGIDYTCDVCYIDLCSDCEVETAKGVKECECRNDNVTEKCPDCDKSLQYIDGGSVEHLERRNACKCSDFKSSQESFNKDVGSLNKTRGYHSSDNIVGYTDDKSKDNMNDTNNSLTNVRNIPKTCLKCCKIKENIVTESTNTLRSRKSRFTDIDRQKSETLRSKSKDDPQRTKLSKISSWRRKSEPGLQQNTIGILSKKSQDSDNEKNDVRGSEKIEFECRNCGSNKISRKLRTADGTVISDLEQEKRGLKSNIEIKMYNTKNVPKKISKLKKNRAKGLRLGSDTTAKFYAELSTDVSTENILHISESNDSLNIDKPNETTQTLVPNELSKDEDIDEETYKRLIEKTDSFKKNELAKVMYLNQQKVINEGSEIEEKEDDNVPTENIPESSEEIEQPLEQIISQLLLQNREFQKLLKKQQLRTSTHKRHQRLLKSHSNPEQVIAARNGDLTKLKPNFFRQSSENLSLGIDEGHKIDVLSPPNEPVDKPDEDHIYETLRVDNKVEDSSDKTKPPLLTSRIARPKRLPSPPKPAPNKVEIKTSPLESDYVYLSFDQLNQIQDSEGIYEVPVKSPEKVRKEVKTTDYYETMENDEHPEVEENLYDNLIDVCRRKKEVPLIPSDYLPMNSDQSPNAPEIWLSRQKEHFNVSRDRKSGSLPRSFQVVTNNQEDGNLSSFKLKPNNNSKTYLNRDGKVMSTDRPYTIASDQSEISYDDVENYMSEGDILKFNNKKVSNDTDTTQNISQSTLDLEEEIDRCYKNNFEEVKLNADKNENHLEMSQTDLNNSMTSSCEVLPSDENNVKEVIHPEHKVYKPNGNMLSLKYMLNKFKNKAPNKSLEENDINANDNGSPDSGKSDLKSPTSEKRSALNPRSYSKNLLQRFRSIIGDEHQDDNQNKLDYTRRKNDGANKVVKNDIQVVITSSEISPTTSTIAYTANNDALSRSVCEQTTLTESQSEKNNLDPISHSCENITQKPDRPVYEKSFSTVSSVSSNVSNNSSPSRSNLNQSLNKLPIYMQGSKLLGARIAQSEYVDPSTLLSEKSPYKNPNVLINKNSVRPDSLFSNSSFVTLSSEDTNQESYKINGSDAVGDKHEIHMPKTDPCINDESFYEKSFEKIEHVTDEDVFRDSAVYSDQEDAEYTKSNINHKVTNKTSTRVESLKKNSSFRAQRVTVTTNEKSTIHTRMSVSSNITQQFKKINHSEAKTENEENITKPKVAPPIPIKPKPNNIPLTQSFLYKTPAAKKSNNITKTQEQNSSTESINVKTIKRNTNYKQNTNPGASSPILNAANLTTNDVIKKTFEDGGKIKDEVDNGRKMKQPCNIQLKRMGFERASLDSATRKLKATNSTNEIKRSSVEPTKTSKTVLERRMEIEQMSKCQVKTSNNTNISVRKSQIAKPMSITTKVATFERSVSDHATKEVATPTASEMHSVARREKTFIEQVKPETTDDPKSSWVKQVVNKFQ